MIFANWYIFFLIPLVFLPFFIKKSRVQMNLVFIGSMPLGIRAYLYRILQFAWFLYLLVLLFFSARPQLPDTSQKKFVEGIDIVLSIDISQSMLAEDFKPNRLELAKSVVKDFIKSRYNDRIGIVAFSGEAYTLVPMSLDHEHILKKIDSLDVNKGEIAQGTAIGVALATASARLKNSKAKSKVIILLTDGDNNTGDIHPITASELAKDMNYKVYTIGVGKEGRAPFPVKTRDFFGNETTRYRYIEGSINNKLLSEIAEKTGAKFFRSEEEESLVKIFKEIDKLEQDEFAKSQKQAYKDIFSRYKLKVLLTGLILLILSTIILRTYP